MNKQDAIAYLQRKGIIRQFPQEKKKEKPTLNNNEEKYYNKEEKSEIDEVIKRGKIYGDPMVILND